MLLKIVGREEMNLKAGVKVNGMKPEILLAIIVARALKAGHFTSNSST